MKEQIGKLNELIVLATPSETRDEYGGEDITWSLSSDIWASVKYLPVSDEKLIASQQTPLTRVDFTIRYRSNLTTKMEVRYESKTYKILSILPIKNKCYQILETESYT